VLVNGRGEIFYIYGRTGKFLEPAPGETTANILSMARDGLRRELMNALHRAVTQKKPVDSAGLRVRTNGHTITANLTVRPVTVGPGEALVPDLFLVILEESKAEELAAGGEAGGEQVSTVDGETAKTYALPVDKRIAALEGELRTKEEYLQTTLEEMETANEELKSTNEEMQSVNEELQSTNEELETAKEEMQSVNEELATVNTELQVKVADLSRANNDMNNLLAGTGVGTLFVDHRMRIVRFTPTATRLINLIQSDIGRPVGHIVSNLTGYDQLVADVQAVLDSLIPVEIEVQTRTGEWYLMRIRPYRTVDNQIEGAVITFAEVTTLKTTELALQAAHTLADSIVATVRDPLLVLDGKLRVVKASQAFYRIFGVDEKKTSGELIFNLGNGQWNISALRTLLEDILPQSSSFDDFEVTHTFERLGERRMLLNARRVHNESDQAALILLAIEDVTEGYKNGEE